MHFRCNHAKSNKVLGKELLGIVGRKNYQGYIGNNFNSNNTILMKPKENELMEYIQQKISKYSTRKIC